ncbi:MAG: prolyl oligopeptidase family serine peptidase, partial [Sphingorhabdus sp.]|uniref:prolyl oligopeptidase family serine peptidase n=1 Tax=Sphingorhabdus sp. TaxID=1902408 RepID=UPI003CB45436
VDPNGWATDGAVALDQWEPSPDGRRVAYAVQDGGSDWRTIKVADVKSGQPLADEIRWAKFTNIAWVGNEGFLYSRFAEPRKGEEFQALNENQTLYFHRIGTPQEEDVAVYATPDRPKLGHSAQVTHDNRWVVITSSEGTDEKHEINLISISSSRGKLLPVEQWKRRALVQGLEYDWQLIEGIGDQIWFVTNRDAPRLKIVKADLTGEVAIFSDIISERKEPLARAQIVGDRLVLSYLENAASIAEMVSVEGQPLQSIHLNAIGTASGFLGKPGDPETFYAFSSFNRPSTIFRFNSATGKSTLFGQPELSFDPSTVSIDQRFYESKDGTKVPMFIVRKKDLDLSKGAPTLLYAYGGFNVPQLPAFDARKMAWIQSGGVYVLANIRGGSEYGKAWHDAGRLLNKQNVFDDFIAAGEYLIKEGITTKDKLAIEGRSNGGLLVGAVVNQRPDLFAAGHAAVGVMDMLRFDRFTAGRYWVDDYGYPNKPADFKNLFGYSPYHNIKSGVDYPAVIVTTADTDDRVVPGHSFKYTAALQAAKLGEKPHILRVETRAGHGAGKPIDKLIEEYSDIYGFLAKWTGLELENDTAK